MKHLTSAEWQLIIEALETAARANIKTINQAWRTGDPDLSRRERKHLEAQAAEWTTLSRAILAKKG